MADLLAQQPLLAYVAVALLGLIVGSFLNVVILRLPRMMEAQWRAGAAEILGQPADAEAPVQLSLARPRSRCNSCQTPIRAWHNIPVVSYLLLRGRCNLTKQINNNSDTIYTDFLSDSQLGAAAPSANDSVVFPSTSAEILSKVKS